MKTSAFVCASLITLVPLAPAETPGNLPPVVARYEQILVKSPQKGTAFDKVYQYYFENEGLDKLTEHWKQAAAAPGEPGLFASYQILLGMLAERQGKTADARAAFTEAAKGAPDDYRAWRALGDLEAGDGKFPAAVAALEKALSCNPPAAERAPLYRQLARSHQRNLDNAAALATWRKMADEFPSDPFVIEEVASAQLEAEQFDEAKKTFTRLRDLAGSDPFKKVTATIRLAQVEERQGRAKDALAIYESALPQASETSWIHRDVRSRIEEVYRRQDDLPGLAAYYEKWIAGHDKDVEAATRLSAALVELNRKKEAVGWLQKAAEWAPDRKEVQVDLAKMLCETDQAEAAQKILAALTRQSPEEQSYWELLGNTEWQLSKKTGDEARKKAALEAWNKLAPAETKDVARIGRLADLLRDKGLDAEALAQYERAVALAPDAADLRERQAAYLFELKRDDAAWKTLDGLVAGDRANANNYQRLATIQARNGKPDEALASVKKGLELSPGEYPLLSLEWRILSERKAWDEAAALYPKMLAASPTMADQTDQQYLQALQAAGKLEAKKKELAERVGQAGEDDLRLLARMALQGDDLPTVLSVLEAGRKCNPGSVPLARIEAEYARRAGNLDSQVAALRRLIELEPKQSGDFLQQIARTYQEQQQWDKAIAAAEEWIKLSPANPDAQIHCAEVCFAANKGNEAIGKLREAIKLSDKPNQIRQRLAQAYLQMGDLTKARQTTEEAFEDEQDAGAKLALVRQLSELYFQAGKIDTLLARFRERQQSEEGGWRYAVYLSEIFQQMQDYSQAREELAKSLASRPKDPALIKQLLRLSEQEDNTAEKARYSKALAEVEPSAENFAALAEALANNNDAPGAVQVLLAHQDDILKAPEPWRMALAKVQKEPAAATLNAALESALQQRPDDFSGRLTFAGIQIAQGNLDQASRILWELRAIPQPAQPAQPAATPAPTTLRSYFYNPFASVFKGRFSQRLMATMNTQQSFEELLSASQAPGQYRRTRYFGSAFFPSPYGTRQAQAADLTSARDTALIYLGSIAVKTDKADEFLAALDRELTGQNASRKERLICYSMIQARERLWREIQAQADSPDGDQELDEICLMQTSQFFFAQNGNSQPEKEKAVAVMGKIVDRLGQADSKRAASLSMIRYSTLMQIGKQEEAQAEAKRILERPLDENDPGAIQIAVQAAMGTGQLDRAEGLINKLDALKQTGGMLPVETQYLKFSLAQSYIVKKDPKNAARLYVSGFVTSLPSQKGGVAPGSTIYFRGMQSSYRGGDIPAVPYPNSYFDDRRLAFLRQSYQALKGANALDAYYEALSKTDLPPEMQIYPKLALAYLKWFDDKKEEALKDARAVLESDPDDEVRLLVAGMLSELKKYPEAIAILDQVTARQGDVYKRAQMLALKFAKAASDQENSKKAALRLIALRPPRNELNQLLPDLKQLGLTEQAEVIQKEIARRDKSSSNDLNEKANLLSKYCQEKKQDEAVELARTLLGIDPLTSQSSGDYYRYRALETLGRFKLLDGYIADLEKQFEAAPDSARTCMLLAEAWSRKDNKKGLEWYRKLVALRSNDTQLRWKLIQSLRNSDQQEEALKMGRDLLASNPDLVFNSQYDFFWIFRDAKKLPELAEIILNQKGPAGFSLNSNNQSFWVCQRLGQALQDDANNLDLAVKVWRKGIELQPPNMMHATSQIRSPLAAALAMMGRKEEALAEVDAVFFPQAPEQKKLFGMTNFYGGSWMSYTTYSNGKIEISSLGALRVAEQCGALDAMRKKAESKAEQNPEMKSLALFIRIRQRDPQLLKDLPKLLDDPKDGQYFQNNQMFPRVMASELAGWPQARQLCMEMLFRVKKQVEMNPGNTFEIYAIRTQILKQALEFGDTKATRTALKEWQEARSNQTNRGFNSDEAFTLIRQLANAGMTPECESLIAFFSALPEAAQDRSFAQKAGWVRAELALDKGELQNPQALAIPAGEEKGKPVILWQIQAVRPNGDENPKPELMGRDLPKLDGRWDLELLAITPPNTVRRIGWVPKAKARGKWTGTLPDGLVTVEAVLYPANDHTTAFRGVPLTFLRSGNLLANADFEGLPEGNAPVKANIKGWGVVPEGAIQQDGPCTGGRQVLLKFSTNNEGSLRGEKIPVEPGKDYLLSTWLRYDPDGYCSLGVKFINSEGKEIGNDSCDTNQLRQGKWGYVSKTYTTGRGEGKRRMDEKVAFLEPYITGRGEARLSSLFLGSTETPAGEKPKPAAKPSASPATSPAASPSATPAATAAASPAKSDFAPAARAYSFADATGKLTVLWEISPIDSVETNLSPVLFGGPRDSKLDGKYDLELVYRIPPNISSRLALIPAAKAAGKWSGKLPADLRELQLILRPAGKPDGICQLGPWSKVLNGPRDEKNKERFNVNEAIALLRSLANFNLTEECESLISVFNALPEARRESRFSRQLEAVQGELALQKGDVAHPQAVAAPVGERDGKTVVLWEIHAAGKDATSLTFPGRDYPKLEGRWNLELLAITKPNNVQQLATVPKAKSRGVWTGTLPEGLVSIEAVLHPAAGETASGITYHGLPLPTLRAANRLINPGFEGLGGLEAPAPGDLKGWSQVPPGIARPGGPHPGETEVLLRFPQQRRQMMLGEKIPVEPGKNYVQSAWLRNASGEVSLGIQYLDKDGKVVGNKAENRNDALSQGHWGYVCQALTSGLGNGFPRIPEKAVFLQPYLQASGDTSVSRMTLTAADVPAMEMPTPTPAPTPASSPTPAPAPSSTPVSSPSPAPSPAPSPTPSPSPAASASAAPSATPDESMLSPVALACASQSDDGKLIVIWETRLTDSRRFNPGHTLFEGTTDPKLDGRYDLELVYRVPPNATQRLALIPHAKAWDQWSGKIPAGFGSVQAILRPAGKESLGLRYEATWTRIVNAPNLLENPGFAKETPAPQPQAIGTEQPSPEPASSPAPAEVKGWQDVPAFTIEQGGPRPGGKYVLFSNPDFAKTKKPVLILGKKIEMKPEKDYTISAWTLYFGGPYPHIGFILLDADGKQVRRDIAGTVLSRKGKWSDRWLTITKSGGSEGRYQSPEETVFIQPFIEVNESLGVDGLFVGESDAPRSPFDSPAP